MMTFPDRGKPVWLATAATEGRHARKLKSPKSFKPITGVSTGPGTDKQPQRYSQQHIHTRSTWCCLTLAGLLGFRVCSGEMFRGNQHSERKRQRASTRNLSHRQLTGRQQYGTSDPYADGTVGDTSFALSRCSSACHSPYTWRGTKYLCQEPAGFYVT